MIRIAIPIWLLLTASLAWAQETTVTLTILGRGGGEEVEIGPEGGLVPYRLFVETDPLGTPGNLGLWAVLISIDSNLGDHQEPPNIDPAFLDVFSFIRGNSVGLVSRGRAVMPDDIRGIGGYQRCLRPRGLCIPASGSIPELGTGQSGPQAVAIGQFYVGPARVGSQFQAKILLEPTSSLERTSAALIRSVDPQGGIAIPSALDPPDQITANALTIRVVANPLSPADVDRDGDVDLADFLRVVECFTGPANPVAQNCDIVDLDWDGSVDLADVVALQAEFTGAR